RLQDIEGALIAYWAVHHDMPAKLVDLAPFADTGTELKFTCPVSNQPYVYVPVGLQSAGRTKRIVVHDATPAHDGNRLCILMAPLPHTKNWQSPIPYFEVLPVPENLFRTYLPVSEQREP